MPRPTVALRLVLPCVPCACPCGASTERSTSTMSLTINRRYRDALYDGLMTDFTAIGDIFSHLHNNEPARAQRLHRRFAAELQLLDHLGWEQEPDVDGSSYDARTGSCGRSSSASTGRPSPRSTTSPTSWSMRPCAGARDRRVPGDPRQACRRPHRSRARRRLRGRSHGDSVSPAHY